MAAPDSHPASSPNKPPRPGFPRLPAWEWLAFALFQSFLPRRSGPGFQPRLRPPPPSSVQALPTLREATPSTPHPRHREIVARADAPSPTLATWSGRLLQEIGVPPSQGWLRPGRNSAASDAPSLPATRVQYTPHSRVPRRTSRSGRKGEEREGAGGSETARVMGGFLKNLTLQMEEFWVSLA